MGSDRIPLRNAGDPIYARDQRVAAKLLRGLVQSSGTGRIRVGVSGGELTVGLDDQGPALKLAATSAMAENVGSSATDDLQPFDTAVIIDQTHDGHDDFMSDPLLQIRPPDVNDIGEVVIVAEDIPIGQAGRVWTTGVLLARVRGDDPATNQYPRADIMPGETSLFTRMNGPAKILWLDPEASGDEERWAVIQLDRRETCRIYRFKNVDSVTIPRGAPMSVDGSTYPTGRVNAGDPSVPHLALFLPGEDDVLPVYINYGADVAAGELGIALLPNGPFVGRGDAGLSAGDDLGAKQDQDYLETGQSGFRVMFGTTTGSTWARYVMTPVGGGGGGGVPRWQDAP